MFSFGLTKRSRRSLILLTHTSQSLCGAIVHWDTKSPTEKATVIGVHTPELDFERDINQLRREVARLGIKYPVVTHQDYSTWKAYSVEAWPTLFVLDKQGRVRWMHVGEGAYDETEQVIKQLLAESVTGNPS